MNPRLVRHYFSHSVIHVCMQQLAFIYIVLGNNHYDDEIKTLLTDLKDDKLRAGYVLMEKIYPWVQKNYLIKTGESIDLREVVSEIGIYGTIIG